MIYLNCKGKASMKSIMTDVKSEEDLYVIRFLDKTSA